MLIDKCSLFSQTGAAESVLGKQFCRPWGGQGSAEQLEKGPGLPLTKGLLGRFRQDYEDHVP